MDTINLTDDNGKYIGITLILKNGKLKIKGLRFLKYSLDEAIQYRNSLIKQVLELEGRGIKRLKLNLFKYISTRNAVRLAFAIEQIICGGPTYFNQIIRNGWLIMTDPADYEVPHIRRNKEGEIEGYKYAG